MFKKFLRTPALATSMLLLILAGCRTGPLPQVNLSEPSWKVFQGQAVWRPKRDLPEIAGEILLAQKSESESFIQFTKTPFPIALAQATTDAWRLEFPTERKTYRFRGKPPARVIWFELARAMSGETLKQPWSWSGSAENWRLENQTTGEKLEGYFQEQSR